MDSSSPDLNVWDQHNADCTTSGRKARLFKTRAETSKRPVQSHKKMESTDFEDMKANDISMMAGAGAIDRKERERKEQKSLVRSASHEVITSRSLASPEFQVTNTFNNVIRLTRGTHGALGNILQLLNLFVPYAFYILFKSNYFIITKVKSKNWKILIF